MKEYVSMHLLHLMLTFPPQNDVMVHGPLYVQVRTTTHPMCNLSGRNRTVACVVCIVQCISGFTCHLEVDKLKWRSYLFSRLTWGFLAKKSSQYRLKIKAMFVLTRTETNSTNYTLPYAV